jgi:DNA polymerase-3 subunit epsilon
MHGGEVIDEFATLVNPGRRIDNRKYHGITTADVYGAPTWGQVAPTLLSCLSGAVMVCHKAKFDHAFLSQEFRRVGIDIGAIPTLWRRNGTTNPLKLTSSQVTGSTMLSNG